jgi:DNA polymerase-3 subunit gamma/tau
VASLALYRKYRPRTFDEVIGQEHITGPLTQAIRNGRLHHAYLFSGPRGCGKTSSARILARSLNCVKGPTPQPCGVCDSCVALAPDGHGSVDVIEIDAASHGGVDDARELRERAFFSPVSSRYKVYVIDEAHMVSSAGFNALLKLVEEPPEFVVFVFATTEPEKVLPTIRSRTHHYPFRLIPPGVLRPYLEQVCKAEQAEVEPAVFPLVVRAGAGSVRDSLSVLDQLIAGADEHGVTYSRAVRLLGVTDVALIDEICDGFAAADGGAIFQAVDRVVEAGHDPRRFAGDLLERLRDLIVLNQVPDAAGKGLLDVPSDELERMTGQALRLGTAELSRIADIVHDGLIQMRGTTAPRLVLELICARALLPGVEDSAQAMLSRLERLERRFDIGGAPPAADRTGSDRTGSDRAGTDRGSSFTPAGGDRSPAGSTPAADSGPASGSTPAAGSSRTSGATPTRAAQPSASPPTPATPPPAMSPPVMSPSVTSSSAMPTQGARPGDARVNPGEAAGGLDAAAVRRVWPEILEHTKRRRVVWSMLQNVMPRAVQGDVLVLDLQHGGLLPRFSDDDVVSVIQDALSAVLGVRWKIRCEVVASRGGPAHAAAPGSESRTPGRSSAPTAPQPSSPPEPPAMYEGFDPGDQPMDDEPVAAGSDRRRLRVVPSPEEQAMATLRDGGLHPETIHGDGPRAG